MCAKKSIQTMTIMQMFSSCLFLTCRDNIEFIIISFIIIYSTFNDSLSFFVQPNSGNRSSPFWSDLLVLWNLVPLHARCSWWKQNLYKLHVIHRAIMHCWTNLEHSPCFLWSILCCWRFSQWTAPLPVSQSQNQSHCSLP